MGPAPTGTTTNLRVCSLGASQMQHAAVGASDPLFDFGAFKLGDVSVRVEGERATVSGILNTRPAGADKKARPRYFYTRALIRRDDRWQVLSTRLVSLAEGSR